MNAPHQAPTPLAPEASGGRSAALVPPRPNPGPEPLEEPAQPWPWVLVMVAAVLGLAVWRTVGRWQRSGATAGPGVETSTPTPTTPRARIAALSAAVRAALAARFDETWLAKTTEEIAESPALSEALGAVDAGRLVAFLREADRVKFALDHDDAQRGELDEVVAWASAFASAGASSTITGK